MASIYQRTTGRRDTIGAGPDEPNRHWHAAEDEAASNHSRGKHIQDDQNSGSMSRSITGNMTSAMSFYTDSESLCAPSRPASLLSGQTSPMRALEKRESSARTLLSKGSRMLRKHGSKFSLSSLYTLDYEASDRFSSRPATAHHVVAAIKREELKQSISAPFNFHHVTHTDLGYLNSLERVPKTELVGEFSALRAGQRSKPQLRGIRAEDLPSAKQPSAKTSRDSLAIDPAVDTTGPVLPEAPPRPSPPPKDLVKLASVRQGISESRSFDNFSRPSPVSPVSPISPPRRYSSRNACPPLPVSPARPLRTCPQSPSGSISAGSADLPENLCPNCGGAHTLCDKPLPGLPLIHAVSTNDDSARHMRATPLPRIPVDLADVPEEDEVKRRSVLTLNITDPFTHASTGHSQANFCPTALSELIDSPKKSPASSDTTVADYQSNPSIMSKSNISEKAGPERLRSQRVSVVHRPINANDWEDAIDYSWELAAEPDSSSELSRVSENPSFSESVTSTNASVESPSHPKSTSVGANCQQSRHAGDRPASKFPAEGPVVVSTEHEYDEAIGAGRLTSARTVSAPSLSGSPQPADSPALLDLRMADDNRLGDVLDSSEVVRSREVASTPQAGGNQPNMTTSPKSHHSATSGISKSSSQESIILSIASSIMGTQRSSNSSTSLLELMPDSGYQMAIKSIEDFKEALETVQDHLQEIQEEPATAPSRAVQSYPPALPRKASHRRAQSLATDFVSRDMGSSTAQLRRSATRHHDGTVPALPTHGRVQSASKIPIPTRKSSAKAAPEVTRPPIRRLRSATTGSRSRASSRASYSLFPGASPLSP